MDEDEEIHSHPSPRSESPSPPHDNARISVTVAAVAQSQRPPHNSQTLALPIQQHRTTTGSTSAGGSAGGGREDCWSEGATSVLIDAWGERYLELSRGNLKQQHWKEVADIVSSRENYSKPLKSDVQCKNRIDTVKKKYKNEKAKIAGGGPPSKWPFFHRLERLLGPTAKIPSATPAPPSAASGQKIPVGIPVGVRSVSLSHYSQQNQLKPKFSQRPSHYPRFSGGYVNSSKQPLRKRPPVDSESEPDDPSPDSTDSFPPETYMRTKRPRVELNNFNSAVGGLERGSGGGGGSSGNGGGGLGGGGMEKGKGWGESVRELTSTILKFGEVYEQAESAKLQQMVEMEKQRMKFAKELELQRMKFLMKTQLVLSQLSTKSRRIGENNNHSSSNNNNGNKVNNSDSSNS
ncbi:hypothetical protein Dimus_003924 [Dionaea muscipula]